MTGRTFWILSFLLVAIASHLAFVLFGNRLDDRTLYKDLVAVTGVNKIQALSISQARQLSSTSDASLVHVVCAYDLSRGPVRLAATFPESYWSVNIYSLKGDVIYTLNDRQANTGKLSIVLGMAGGREAENGTQPATEASLKEIQVLAEAPRGLAVLRSSIIHEKQRKRSAETLSQAACDLIKS